MGPWVKGKKSFKRGWLVFKVSLFSFQPTEGTSSILKPSCWCSSKGNRRDKEENLINTKENNQEVMEEIPSCRNESEDWAGH